MICIPLFLLLLKKADHIFTNCSLPTPSSSRPPFLPFASSLPLQPTLPLPSPPIMSIASAPTFAALNGLQIFVFFWLLGWQYYHRVRAQTGHSDSENLMLNRSYYRILMAYGLSSSLVGALNLGWDLKSVWPLSRSLPLHLSQLKAVATAYVRWHYR